MLGDVPKKIKPAQRGRVKITELCAVIDRACTFCNGLTVGAVYDRAPHRHLR